MMYLGEDGLKLVKEALREFLFTKKHLLHWVEFISVLGAVDEARDALLSLSYWILVSLVANLCILQYLN